MSALNGRDRGREGGGLLKMGEERPEQCPGCGVFVWGGLDNHWCVKYDQRPCVECGEPTTFVTIAAPGYGQGFTCRAGHYDGTIGELTPEDVR